jgi:hypothetical protein
MSEAGLWWQNQGASGGPVGRFWARVWSRVNGTCRRKAPRAAQQLTVDAVGGKVVLVLSDRPSGREERYDRGRLWLPHRACGG